MTLILVYVAFLVLASPILIVEAIFTFVNVSTSAKAVANVALMKTIFQKVCSIFTKSSCYTKVVVNFWRSDFSVNCGFAFILILIETLFRFYKLSLPLFTRFSSSTSMQG